MTLVSGDMTTLSFEPTSFDGVASFFTTFHLQRVEQKLVLSNICVWVKLDGLLVFNLRRWMKRISTGSSWAMECS